MMAPITKPTWFPENATEMARARSFKRKLREMEAAFDGTRTLCPKPKIMRNRKNETAALATGSATVDSPQITDPVPITIQGPKRSITGPTNIMLPVYDQFHPERM